MIHWYDHLDKILNENDNDPLIVEFEYGGSGIVQRYDKDTIRVSYFNHPEVHEGWTVTHYIQPDDTIAEMYEHDQF